MKRINPLNSIKSAKKLLNFPDVGSALRPTKPGPAHGQCICSTTEIGSHAISVAAAVAAFFAILGNKLCKIKYLRS